MIFLVEGARNSGKTYFLSKTDKTVYKFPFSLWYHELSMDNYSYDSHQFALAKEIMLHDLNRSGLIQDDIIIDRGILTTFVWGIMNKRITATEATDQLYSFINERLFDNVTVIYIKADNPPARDFVDVEWTDDTRSTEKHFFEEIILENPYFKNNVKVVTIENNFDEESVERFLQVIETYSS